MPEDELGHELARLHAMLSEQSELSEEQRVMLRKLAVDIEAALGNSEASPEISNQLDRLILDFESHHPTMSNLLRRIVDGLSNLGI